MGLTTSLRSNVGISETVTSFRSLGKSSTDLFLTWLRIAQRVHELLGRLQVFGQQLQNAVSNLLELKRRRITKSPKSKAVVVEFLG